MKSLAKSIKGQGKKLDELKAGGKVERLTGVNVL